MNNKIPFVESIPSDWRLVPNKYLFKPDGYKVGDNWKKYQLLSLTTLGVKEKEINSGGGKVPDNFEGYQTVKSGQMIFCLFDLDCSAVFSGISQFDGMITSAYSVFSSTDLMMNEYADYWFKYVFSNRYYKMYSKNIRFTITDDMFGLIYSPVPSIEEQRLISTKLSKAENKILSLIKIESNQIEKLEEYKLAVITKSVKCGFKESSTNKNSGIEWIGDIPEKCSISKVANFYEIVLGKMLQPNKIKDNDTLESYLCASNVGGNTLKLDNIKKMWFSEKEKSQYKVEKGDLLVVEGGDVASSAIYDGNIGDVYIQNALHRVRSIKGDLHFLRYYLMFVKNSGYFEVSCNRATIAHFTKEKFQALPFIVFNAYEQKEISKYLDEICNSVDKLICIKKEKISALLNYKNSLIFEYVTGKKRVGDLKYE